MVMDISYWKCCRLCLNESQASINCIGVDVLTNSIKNALDIEISENDQCSTKICPDCSNKVIKYANFRDVVKKNQETIKNLQSFNAQFGAIKKEESDEEDVIFVADYDATTKISKYNVDNSENFDSSKLSPLPVNNSLNNNNNKESTVQNNTLEATNSEISKSGTSKSGSSSINGENRLKNCRIILEPLDKTLLEQINNRLPKHKTKKRKRKEQSSKKRVKVNKRHRLDNEVKESKKSMHTEISSESEISLLKTVETNKDSTSSKKVVDKDDETEDDTPLIVYRKSICDCSEENKSFEKAEIQDHNTSPMKSLEVIRSTTDTTKLRIRIKTVTAPNPELEKIKQSAFKEGNSSVLSNSNETLLSTQKEQKSLKSNSRNSEKVSKKQVPKESTNHQSSIELEENVQNSLSTQKEQESFKSNLHNSKRVYEKQFAKESSNHQSSVKLETNVQNSLSTQIPAVTSISSSSSTISTLPNTQSSSAPTIFAIPSSTSSATTTSQLNSVSKSIYVSKLPIKNDSNTSVSLINSNNQLKGFVYKRDQNGNKTVTIPFTVINGKYPQNITAQQQQQNKQVQQSHEQQQQKQLKSSQITRHVQNIPTIMGSQGNGGANITSQNVNIHRINLNNLRILHNTSQPISVSDNYIIKALPLPITTQCNKLPDYSKMKITNNVTDNKVRVLSANELNSRAKTDSKNQNNPFHSWEKNYQTSSSPTITTASSQPDNYQNNYVTQKQSRYTLRITVLKCQDFIRIKLNDSSDNEVNFDNLNIKDKFEVRQALLQERSWKAILSALKNNTLEMNSRNLLKKLDLLNLIEI